MNNEIFSNAKIILMGEYAVMHGADAICLPLKTGQKLRVEDFDEGVIGWKWTYGNEVLADLQIDAASLQPLRVNKGNSQWVSDLVRIIRLQNPGFVRNGGHSFIFENLFPPQWGLGSSSATISSISRWAHVNAFMVNQKLMGGSGADIASTTASRWFLYRKKLPTPPVWDIPFNYLFPDNTWFVYSGKKEPTAQHLNTLDPIDENQHSVSWMQVNHFIYRFLAASTLPEVFKLVYEHELLIADRIRKEPIGNQFADFPGKIKSLGAWGGDFFLALSQQPEAWVKDYFYQKGYSTIFKWNEFLETETF